MISITKEFTFDVAHFLPNHEGLCANIHGHTYKLQVAINGIKNKTRKDTEEGMLIDFSRIKVIVKEEIVDKFDHAFLVGNTDNELEKKVEEFLLANNFKTYNINARTTAENISEHIFKKLKEKFQKEEIQINISKVILWETATSFAEYKEEL